MSELFKTKETFEENCDEEFNAMEHLLEMYYNNRKPDFESYEDVWGVFW